MSPSKNTSHLGLHRKLPIVWVYITKFGFSEQVLMKFASITSQGNPSSESSADRCGRMGLMGMKLIGAFDERANSPKNC